MGSSSKDFGQELQNQVKDVLSRLESKNLFQSDWDIAAFVVFFTFIGVVVVFALIVLIRCCCCCCDCENSRSSYKQVERMGIDNKAMEP